MMSNENETFDTLRLALESFEVRVIQQFFLREGTSN